MSDTSTNPFSQQVIDGVASHMNLDHLDNSLRIVQTLGSQPDATSAEVSGLDGDGIDFAAVIDGKPHTVRVPWQHPLTERPEIRAEVERMDAEACRLLGIEPATEEG